MWDEDPTIALKILMNLRDYRNGKGEKKLSRIILFFLKIVNISVYSRIVNDFCSEIGCYKDLLIMCEYSLYYGLTYDYELEIFASQLKLDMKNLNNLDNKISLAAKWAPNEKGYYNKNGLNIATKLAYKLDMTPRQYRKNISNSLFPS